MAGFTRGGLHELQPVPDDLLTALKPQVVVTVGTYEHADAINRHRARAQHLRDLLPGTIIGVRWWPDDNILDRFTPQAFADTFFKLHVPGTVLFVGNEDANSHSDPAIFAATVAKHTEVLKLATAAGIPIGTCCMSTGNPARVQYTLYTPLLREMQRARQLGVYHWLRLNRYFTAIDASHIREHEQPLAAVCTPLGLPVPPIIIGELGALRSYAEPERGYHAMGWSDGVYFDAVKRLDVPYPYAVYCAGAGVYDQRWADCAVTPAFVQLMAQHLPRTDRTALEEWKAKNVPTVPTVPTIPTVTDFRAGVVTGVLDGFANVRAAPYADAGVKILRQLKVGDAVSYSPTLIPAGSYKAAGRVMNTWQALRDGGFVASGVITFGQSLPVQDVKSNSLDVPFYSQLGTNAIRRNNDCGIACVLMLHAWRMRQVGLLPATALTVDRLVEDTPLKAADVPLGLGDLVNLLAAYGVKAHTALNLTPEALKWEIDVQRPPILLVNYRPFGGSPIGHYVVATAYGSRGFWLHDPYLRGANTYLTAEQLIAAQTEMKGIAGAPYQGVVLG